MIYLFINGNCGNQFFQYAFARTIMEKTGDQLAICWRSEEDMEKRNQLKYFNVKECENIPEHKSFLQRTLYYKMRTLLCKDSSKYDEFDRKWHPFFRKLGVYILYHGYYPLKIERNKNYYLTGYFESPKYFDEVKKVIMEDFTPKHEILDKNRELYRKIQETESVCVTIRRGDFLSGTYKDKFYVCDEKYFYHGVKYIKETKPNAVLFIFSDDVEWVKNNMDFGNVEIYYESGDDPIWEKIRLMYSCKHFIISNSSFSWWAQYLSRNEDKIVVAPKIWRRDDTKSEDIFQEEWIKIGG